MNTKKLYEYERRNLRYLKKFILLPNYFKKIGAVLLVLSSVVLLALLFLTEAGETLMLVVGKVLLISLLVLSISKEKIEDELVANLRAQSYSIAFICGVAYAIFQPFVNLLVASVIKPETANFSDLSVSVILWFMLTIQLCFFHLLKRTT